MGPKGPNHLRPMSAGRQSSDPPCASWDPPIPFGQSDPHLAWFAGIADFAQVASGRTSFVRSWRIWRLNAFAAAGDLNSVGSSETRRNLFERIGAKDRAPRKP